jgi:hypothetical protein
MANDRNPTTKRGSRREKPTELETSAVTFAGLLAQNVDERRGINTEFGTPETQVKVVAAVKDVFFKYAKKGD